MNICVLGDSHTVALKKGYPAVQDEFPDCRATFFAGPGDWLNALNVTDGKLTAGSEDLQKFFKLTSGGEECIEPRYDVYLLVGVALRLSRAARLCLSMLQKRLKAGDDSAPGGGELLRLIHSDFTTTIANDVMTKLRQVTDAPAFLMATPYPGLTANREIWKRLKRCMPLDRLERTYNAACEKLCAAHGVRFLRQPEETIARNGVTTRAVYTRAGTDEAEDRSDDTHMTSGYGAIVLRAALREITAQPPRAG